MKIDFVSMPECKLNSCNPIVRSNIPYLFEKYNPGCHVKISNTPGFGTDEPLQYGGVLSAAIGNISGKFAGTGHDDAGRFNWITFRGKAGYLKVYTVYRVCDDCEQTAGDSSAWTSQKLFLERKLKNTMKEKTRERFSVYFTTRRDYWG